MAAAIILAGCDRPAEAPAGSAAKPAAEQPQRGFWQSLFPGLSQMRDLEDRARAFWAARVAGDLVTTYEYEDAKPLGTMSLQQYVSGRGGLHYKSAQVRHAECGSAEAGCTVYVDIEYVVPGLGLQTMKSSLKDPWVSIEGQWYHRAKRAHPLTGAPAEPASADKEAR